MTPEQIKELPAPLTARLFDLLRNQQSDFRCVEWQASHANLERKLAAAVSEGSRLNALVDEFLTAVERADLDIGGSRSGKEILMELGPSQEGFDETLAAIKEPR